LTAGTNGISLYTALPEQLGLKLEIKKAPLDVLVIDHVEKPRTRESCGRNAIVI
jgi:uncharacterized protein (TIGR03435 family)